MEYKRGESNKKLKDKLDIYLDRPATIAEQEPLFIIALLSDKIDDLIKRVNKLEKL